MLRLQDAQDRVLTLTATWEEEVIVKAHCIPFRIHLCHVFCLALCHHFPELDS